MSESTTRADAVPPPPVYPTNPQPYATYGANPMGPPVAIYPQGVMYPPMNPNIQKIHEYLPWSLINLCLGGFILGLIPVAFSLQTRSRKQRGDAGSAKCWSRATLICNICVTLISIGLIIFIIVYYVTVVNAVQSGPYSYSYYGK